MGKATRIGLLSALGIVFVGVVGTYAEFRLELAPTPKGPSFYVRWSDYPTFKEVARRLQARGVITHPATFVRLAHWLKRDAPAIEGTYWFQPGMTAEAAIWSIRHPVHTMVRIPDGWWIARIAKRLEEKKVCSADEYIQAANNPSKFKDAVKFKLPEDSLEGYLYPDTYDLPPLLGADAVIRLQLRDFQDKVIGKVPTDDPNRTLTIASMVALEVAADKERPVVASVIENRLAKDMALQIDATVLYAEQEWRVLGPGEVRKVDSPYNTYLYKGLPPGPIGSPGIKDIEAAAKPAVTKFLFYVARPTRTHYFTTSYPDHQTAIHKARLEWEAYRAAKP